MQAALTLADRAALYNAAFPQFPASHLRVVQERGQDVIYGQWVLGNDYRNKTRLYGAYPPGYLPRVLSMFPDVAPRDMLHAFAGSLPPGEYVRLDLNPAREPDVVGDVCDAPRLLGGRMFRVAFADPPYSADDAAIYGTPMVDRRRATAALAEVVAPGGFLVWLDTTWPMHRKALLRTCGRIPVEPEEWELDVEAGPWRDAAKVPLTRSTNHRYRQVAMFQRAR